MIKRKLAVGVLVAILGLYFLSMTAQPPTNLGIKGGKLSDLPNSPNAISTQTDDETRRMSSIPFSSHPSKVMDILVRIIEEYPRSEIKQRTKNYIHAEFTSLFFRFIDDVEFLIDESNNEIHFRSASRVGHSDLGANRNRMQKITQLIESTLRESDAANP